MYTRYNLLMRYMDKIMLNKIACKVCQYISEWMEQD